MAGNTQAIRCDHDGLKMAEVRDGHLILRTKHHGETHVKIVSLEALAGENGVGPVKRRGAAA
ncbi:MAG: hypothetical protein IIC83_10405 [Chloroflexi bacterium]|nr:hypothetical protein [Chloroflexota bacterium]